MSEFATWRWTTLGDECEIVSGSTPKTNEPAFWDGDIPWLTPADLSKWKGTYIDGGYRYITRIGLNSCSARLFPRNTVMMSSRAPIGYTAIANREMCTNQGFKSMLPSPTVDPEWLRYFLEHALPEIKAMASGTTFAEISGKKLGTLPMHLPPLEEQRRIVETLDDHLSRLDKALAECSNARSSLTLFERAIIHEAFSSEAVDSEMVDFKHFFNVLQPKFEGYKQKDYLAEGKLPIIDQGNALIGGYVNEMTRRIETQRPLVIFGDHTRCVKFVEFSFAIGADGTKMLEPAENVEPRFAYWQLRGTKLRNRGYARHMGELRKARFWLPQASTQKEITQKVELAFESSNQLRAHLEAQESAVDLMRRSILHAAFSGKMKGLKSNG